MSKVASFDVFDTVLTRAVGSPEALFLLLGRRLCRMSLIQGTPEAYARARFEAERRAYKNVRGGECKLHDIYAELGSSLMLTEAQSRHLLEQECLLETEVIRPVPGAHERIQRARALGQRVVFVSDMYLPASFIQQQLMRHGLWLDGDRCYVSCERGKSKRTGALFAELLQHEGVSPNLITHQGNSLEHDVWPAKRAGLQVEPLLEANPRRYEKLLESYAYATEGLASVMAGASRLARLSIPVLSPKEAALRDVAAGVAAPTLVSFTLWVLHRAQQLGLQRLYFLSRDGQILLEIARRLARELGLSCDLRYLYGSRQSWNLPAMTESSAEQLAWIWDSTDLLSVKSLLARVGIEPKDVQEQLRSIGLTSEDWSRSLYPDERLLLQQVIQTRPLQELILQRAAQKRQILLKYLEQEGVLGSTAWGIVDLGWYGSMQNSISKVLAEVDGRLPIGFYFALWKGEVVDTCPVQRETYYFDERQSLGFIEAVPDIIALMEMFCAADHGTVVAFREENGQIRPVLKEDCNQKVVDWGLPLVRQTIYCFVDNLLLNSDLVNVQADTRDAITSVLQSFWWRPSVTEVRTWADFPWEDGLGTETYLNRLAESYSWQDIIRTVCTGRIELHHRASWFAGSMALTPLGIRVVLKGLARVARVLRTMRSRLKQPLAST